MKKKVRQFVRDSLLGLAPEVVEEKSRKIADFLAELELFQQAKVLLLYLPMPDEVDVGFIAQKAWDNGKTVTAPTAPNDRNMLPVVVFPDSGAFSFQAGLRSPLGEAMDVEELDLIIVPGLAFDSQGRRLGRGGGFYDRFLSLPRLRAATVGVAFSEQILPDLPIDTHDRPVQALVCDHGVVLRPQG